jgi:hypothetical protein
MMPDDPVTFSHTANHTLFLSGPPGCGKTTLGVRRLHHLLAEGIPGEQILILVPQRTLAAPYYEALHAAAAPAGGMVTVATIGGLATRTLDLFWPLVAEPAGFARPDHPLHFLTLETAQYYMDRIVEPFVSDGAFDGITIPRPRLVSQIIDNLNKAAAVGFPPDEIAPRLKAAWSGESATLRVFDQVQAAALAFRQACLAGNLLDWSLQIETFQRHLLPLPELRRYLLSGYRHLIVDNTEEDIPASHDLLKTWLPLCESGLVIHDTDGGYRVFLGADPDGALELGRLCKEQVLLSRSHVTSPQVAALGAQLSAPFIQKGRVPDGDARATGAASSEATDLSLVSGKGRPLVPPSGEHRFHPQMLDWVADEISRLVMEEAIPQGEIAVLAPFLSDSLRFSLVQRLKKFHIDVRTHRPSRALRDEAPARCLLTLAKLAHPTWHRPPPTADVAQALMQSIADLDPVRARLLTDIVFRVREGAPLLTPFHQIVPQTQERISFLLGTRYDELRGWIQDYVDTTAETQRPEQLDHFLSRLFGEVLSQAGFGFHRDFDAGAVAANLIESVRKFRQSMPPPPPEGEEDGPAPGTPFRESAGNLAVEYVDLVERGVVAAQYISSWQVRPENAVLLVPAYTFLMMNQPVTIQFWLDAGNRSWSERIYQPLTHPYVLRRNWPRDDLWTDENEVEARDMALGRLILGLTRRCRERIYLTTSELSEQGYEQQGPLLQAVQRILREHRGERL